jgi:hypothetical protein
MKLKNFVLLDNSFVEAMKYFSKQHIPIALAFSLDKCLDDMQKEMERVNKHRNELFKKYGNEKELENGEKVVQVSPENIPAFTSEMNELINLEFEVPIDKKIGVSLSKLANLDISPEYLNKLKMLIEFKE